MVEVNVKYDKSRGEVDRSRPKVVLIVMKSAQKNAKECRKVPESMQSSVRKVAKDEGIHGNRSAWKSGKSDQGRTRSEDARVCVTN